MLGPGIAVSKEVAHLGEMRRNEHLGSPGLHESGGRGQHPRKNPKDGDDVSLKG